MIDRDTLHQLVNLTETLLNLNYLIGLDSEDPDAVRRYVLQSEERLRALGKLLQSIE